jgi:hypothetical protein
LFGGEFPLPVGFPNPGVGHMKPGDDGLPVQGQRFAVTMRQHDHVVPHENLRFTHLDRAHITLRQRPKFLEQIFFSFHGAFFVSVKTAFREILPPHRHITGRDGVEQFLRHPLQLFDDSLSLGCACYFAGVLRPNYRQSERCNDCEGESYYLHKSI